MSRYFLTGGTGTVGSCILEHLLAQPDSHVYLLVRANSNERAEERKFRLLQTIMGADGAKYADRVTAIRGDTKLSLFGMPQDQYQRLADACTHVIHSAGLVRMNLPLKEARDSAVDAAENVIALARTLQQSGQLQKVEFVSTVGVGGHSKEVTEDWIETPRGFHNTYEQAKAEAEVPVRAAVGEGLPITVHRPSMVVGDSVTGRIISFQVFYHLCEFLTGSRSRGLFPPFGGTSSTRFRSTMSPRRCSGRPAKSKPSVRSYICVRGRATRFRSAICSAKSSPCSAPKASQCLSPGLSRASCSAPC